MLRHRATVQTADASEELATLSGFQQDLRTLGFSGEFAGTRSAPSVRFIEVGFHINLNECDTKGTLRGAIFLFSNLSRVLIFFLSLLLSDV